MQTKEPKKAKKRGLLRILESTKRTRQQTTKRKDYVSRSQPRCNQSPKKNRLALR